MASFVVSGKKLEEAEAKIRELELKLAGIEKENSMMKEELGKLKDELEKLTKENTELRGKVQSTVFSVDKTDVEKAKDQIMEKAKGAMGEYLQGL